MLVLGIESSTPQASVAIGSEQGIVGSCLVSRGSTTGEFLLPGVAFLMQQCGLSYRGLSAVAIGIGPGLFTGMRIGVASAKTIAQALGIPAVGLSSLDLLAYDARYSSKVICPVLDAKRSEVFFAFYRSVPGGVTRISEYSVGSPDRIAAEIEGLGEEVLLVGNGALLYKRDFDELARVDIGTIANAFPRASSLVELALPRLFREDFDRLLEIEPMYMRRSDAELNWERRQAR